MAMAWPVMNPFSGEPAHRIACATSSGVPSLRIGTPRTTWASACSGVIPSFSTLASIPACTIGVRAKAGQIAFTRIPRRAFSAAAERVRPTTPCLAAE